MGANGNSRGDTKDWPRKATLAFLHMLNEKMKQIGECSFKSSVWREIDRELHAQSGGETYGVDCLKSKLNRLRMVYREFSKVLDIPVSIGIQTKIQLLHQKKFGKSSR